MLGYEVLKKLADGAAAEAFLARQEGSQDRVILEILRPELVLDSELIQEFLDQAQARRQLEHPHVTHRVSTGRTPDGRLFVVTEPVEGESLSATLWSHGSLEVQDLIRLALPLCDALEYLHRSGVVHGGVKPENVYLSGGLKAHNPKLLDFALALFHGRKEEQRPAIGAHEPEYLAPECLSGHKSTARSDIYGLGILMYEALTGFPPFSGSNPDEVLRQQRTEVPPLPASCERLTPIVRRCLQLEPLDRYSSAAELKEALTRELTGDVAAATFPGPRLGEAEAKPGDVVGSYELIKLLGEGAMGRVFSGRHTRLGRKAALKLLRPEKARDHLLVDRFFREARAANQINHEHIVQIFDFIDEPLSAGERRVYFVMELLEGMSLGDLLRHEPVRIKRTLRIAQQICTALQAAHDVGVVHRDVKPDNIFLVARGTREDFVKVLDFGVAKLVASPGELPVFKTLKGAVVGTPAFMSPEQATGLEADERTDIYAVGNLLYRAMSGRLPFQASSYGQLLVSIVSQPPPPLPEVTPSGEVIPGELRDVVMSCLSKEPSQRPPTMGALRQMLTRSSEHTALHPVAQIAPTLLRRRSDLTKHRRWTYAAVALLTFVALGFGWLWQKRSAPTAPRSSIALTPHPSSNAVVPTKPTSAPMKRTLPAPANVRLEVTSEPSGARVYTVDSGAQIGTTPLSRMVPRMEGEFALRLEMPGYLPVERKIRLSSDAFAHAKLQALPPPFPPKRRPRGGKQDPGVNRDDIINPFER